MKVVLCILLTLKCVSSFDNSDEYINEINSIQNLWRAGRNFHESTPMSEIRRLFGVMNISQSILKSIPMMIHEINDSNEIPASFDARTQWSNCTTIQQVADQSACGSSWAVSVASAISDRICIHSNGTRQLEISANYLMSCCLDFAHGCLTGYPYYAWLFWKTDGIVTGGAYDSKIGCQPYPFPPCDHNNVDSKTACSASEYLTPECVKTCDNGTLSFDKDLTYGSSVYRIIPDEEQIQTEIMKNGPVVAAFTIFSDFLHYKSGVYAKSSNTSEEFKHAVRIIGWGVEDTIKYWLAANSWNQDWGDKGLFKIRRGVNECGIEMEISAGLPK